VGDPQGFMKHGRELPARRPVEVRIQDWREVYEDFDRTVLRHQASRCMDCGIPFCHQGCPLGNLIPEWNDLVYREDWREAAERLHATNNFPEFTGRLCPAPCETACVLGINEDPVTIKQVEVEIIDRAFAEGFVRAQQPARRTGKRVAVVGSGPAGLAAAQQLTRAGHEVTLYERANRIGGLLRYGIPEFKMEKRHLERRLAQMREEGTRFITSCDIGVDITGERLRTENDAIVLALGATVPRDLPVPGRELTGVYFAMEYLTPSNHVREGDLDRSPIDAAGKHVVIIGGGDTGADCLGTAHRQRAASVTQLEILARPPAVRDAGMPWPTYPMTYRVSSAHEEGGERVYAVSTERFVGTGGTVTGLVLNEVRMAGGRFEPVPGSTRELPCDLAFLAMGFTGAQRQGIAGQLGVDFDQRGNIARDASWQSSVPGVFVAGDAGRGQSLIVWAIAEGRSAAACVDQWLMGDTMLPAPIHPTALALRT
jgi:glutamate synthase (NADPH) small chain